MGFITTNYDRFLLVGDFNVHVCCPSNTLSKEFLTLIESFNLVQWINDATHIHGHILDLVLTHGFAISVPVLSDTLLSDHKPILFSLLLPELSSVSVEAQTQSRYYSPHFKSDFNELFNVQSAQLSLDSSFPDLDVNQHIELLNAAWLDILNVTAPFKLFKPKPKSDYWHTSNTRLLRQACRKAKMAKGQIPVII